MQQKKKEKYSNDQLHIKVANGMAITTTICNACRRKLVYKMGRPYINLFYVQWLQSKLH